MLFEISFAIGLVLSILSGFLIGAERELRNKDAGISTHILVITGSMIYTFLSAALEPSSPTKIAAGIVSGIGFLGAGLIIRDGASVRNLTTAASVWFAGAIGMAYGFGFPILGGLATLVSVLVPRIPRVRLKNKDSINIKNI